MTLKSPKKRIFYAREQFQTLILVVELVTERKVFPSLRGTCPFSKGPDYPQRTELQTDEVGRY